MKTTLNKRHKQEMAALIQQPTTTFTVYTYQTPYGSWVFDDSRVNLHAEPFVAGADSIVELLAIRAGIIDPARGFLLVFSSEPFKGHQIKLDWKSADSYPQCAARDFEPLPGAGNTYACPEYGLEGWLCPALYRYFRKAPKHIYAAAFANQTTTRTHNEKTEKQSNRIKIA